jgi:hypothetical protein
MALFKFTCEGCGAVVKRFAATAEEAASRGGCKVCRGELKRSPTGPTATVVEVLDNGARVQKLERFADAERMTAERARNADPLAGTRHEPAPKDPEI